MKILIAHPNISYLEATKQMLRAQNTEYQPDGATSIDEIEQRIERNSYDVIVLDSELAEGDFDLFFSRLESMAQDLPIILTINENESDSVLQSSGDNLFDTVIKKKGYLSSLSNSIKRAAGHEKPKIKNLKGVPQAASFMKSTDKPVRNYIPDKDAGNFICDRRGRFLSANKQLQVLTRYSEDELLELTILDLISKQDADDFFIKVFDVTEKRSTYTFTLTLVNKTGERLPVELRMRILRDEIQPDQIIGFRGSILVIKKQVDETAIQKIQIDQNKMVSEVTSLIQLSYSEPLNVLLKRMAQVVSQVFGFKRSTVALLDRRKHVFIKQAMVGFNESGTVDERTMEVPQEVINRIFADRFKIKVIYHSQDQRDGHSDDRPDMPERRTQQRRPLTKWHKRDLVLLNLTDSQNNTFGYISLDDPLPSHYPTRSTFYNLELFGKMISMAVENYYRFSNIERQSRRMRQILVTSNIFKLYLSLSELLKEVVWSVKFSLEFNLVSLVLISKNSGMLETKAVACDDKIKQNQLRELNFDLKQFSDLLKDEYRQRKSYFINQDESILRPMKRIYYGAESNSRFEDGWPNWGLLLVPIKSREGKIIGFMMADDPQDSRLPSTDTIHTLEILANQIAIAIDNRVMYVQAKEQMGSSQPAKQRSPLPSIEEEPEPEQRPQPEPFGIDEQEDFINEADDIRDMNDEPDYERGGFKKIVERFLR